VNPRLPVAVLVLAVTTLPALAACSSRKGEAERASPAGASAAGGAAAAAPASSCPTGPAAPAVEPARLIEDFAGGGPLEGRTRATPGFAVREQFQATPDARFDPAPAVDAACAGGAAHVKGTAAGTGATYTLVFSGPPIAAGAPPARSVDASRSQGIAFRAALGSARANRLHTVELGVLGSKWSYAKDFALDGTAWQRVAVRWSDLHAAPGAPPFSPATLNQIVFSFPSGGQVDLYLDDLAFIQ
jgi:hypothetical protein